MRVFFILVASANNEQRVDDDVELEIRGPESSVLARKRAAKQNNDETD